MKGGQQQRTRKPSPPRPRRARPAGGGRAALSLSFTDLFEHASDIIILNDRGGRIVAANRVAREFGGYSAEDVARGVDLRDVLPPQDYEAAMALTQRAFDGLPFPEVYEREAILRDGGRRVLELRSNVLRRPGREPLLETIGRDVTDSKGAATFQASLLQVSQALLTAQSVDELGKVICEEASRVLHADGVYLWLRRGDELIGCAAAGRAAGALVGLRRPLEGSVVGEIYRAADVLVVNDFQHSLYNVDAWRDFNVQAMMAVPLRRSAAPVGVLVFTDSTNPRCFTRVLRDRALIFGAQTTVAIESALAREREEEEGRVSAALLQVTRAIREGLEEAQVLPQIARSAREVLQCDWTFVTLRHASLGVLRVVATEGWPAEMAEELRLIDFRPEAVEELAGLLDHETVAVQAPPATHPGFYDRWNVSSFLVVPMTRAGQLIGTLAVGYRQRRGPFSARERRIAEGIAAQAAVAFENARLVQDLRRANQLKSEFLNTMSHELRTPLNAILGYAELMREGALGAVDPQQEQALERVLINGRSLLELINTTLDVNRLEAGRIEVEPSHFQLQEVVAELRDEFAARLTSSDVPVHWPAADTDPPPLCTDRGKLKVIVRNLVDNAVKFTRTGSVSVATHYDGETGRVRLVVRDTGVGMPSDALTQIFDMFRQLEDTRWSSRGGVGLGLYLVRRYTQLMGGEVRVESAVGEGSTFTVDIPARLS